MLAEKNNCVGCGSCSVRCPQNAILMSMDTEGFLYPKIDIDKCIGCKVCEKACPIINWETIQIANHNLYCYAGFLKNKDLLKKSSSGGIATALAKTIIACGGVVFGVAYTQDFKMAEFISCETNYDIDKIRGTKYIQSRKNDVYKNIENKCIQGKKTLVIGLPCEIAAVKSFLGKEYKNLYTCELICHGPTSEKVQKQYLEMLERKFKSKITEYNVRYKKNGWTPLYVRVKFKNNRIYEQKLDKTDFFHAFTIFLRPSCYRCKYKGNRRVADISIGDFWGNIKDEKFYNEDGVSAIMIHTEKGNELFGKINEMVVYPVEYNIIQTGNPRIDICEKEDKNRKKFADIFAYKKLGVACILTRRLRRTLKNILCNLHIKIRH